MFEGCRHLIVAFVAAERELLAPLGLSVPQLWRGVERASARLSEPPLTLCHGDCHIGNTYQLRVKPPTHSADQACCLAQTGCSD